MNDNKVTLLGFLFFLFCAALIGGVWYVNGELVRLQGEYDELAQSQADLKQETESLMAQKRVFETNFRQLEQYKVNVASSDMGFYAEVQQVVQSSGINILSTQQPRTNAAGRTSLALKLKGDYYSFLRVLADWRNLDTTVRVSAMNMTASKTPETRGEVEVDVTVEAIVSGKK